MGQVAVINARIDARVKALAVRWCQANGLVMARFLEDAILDKLEEVQDVAELESLRREPVRPLREVLKELAALKPKRSSKR